MTAKVLSIAMIEPVGGHGGMNLYDAGLCGGLIKAGCRVSLYTCDETKAPDLPGLSFHPAYKGIFGKDAPLLRAFRFLVASCTVMVNAVRSGERICHCHFFHGGANELFIVLLARLFLRDVVITVHDVESFGVRCVSSRLAGAVYGLADGIIVHNRISQAEVVQKLGIPLDKIRIIPHGNYLYAQGAVVGKAEARRLLGLEKSHKVILFFGQIKDVKGLDVLVRALPSVLAEQPDTVLLIAGKTWKSDFSYYEAVMDEAGVRSRCVSHIRYIPDEEAGWYYRACDVVVLPYRRIYQSGVVLMAMSYGRAVLVSDLPGMTEIVSDGENGFVFSQGCEQSLALKLRAVLGDDSLRGRVAGNGLKYVLNYHDWSRIGASTARLYDDVLNQATGRCRL